MNKKFFVATLVLLAAYVLSACGGVPQQADQSSGEQAAIKVRAVEVAYTGVIEAITDNEWTVNGQVLSIAPTVVNDGPFQVGDIVKVEGNVNPDGSLTASRVEAPTASDLTDLPILGGDNSNDTNTNVNSNGDDDEDDDHNSNGNSNSYDDDEDYDHDSNFNGNGNSDDDEDDDHGSSSSSGKNGGSGGGSSHDSDDDDHGGGNSNGGGDDSDDD